MNPNLLRLRAWLWWLIPFAALALLLGIETDWGRAIDRLPGPAPSIEPKPIAAALLPEYRVDGGLETHAETVSRTLFNPTRRPAPPLAVEAVRVSMPKGRFLLMGTAVAGERHLAFLKEVGSGKSRVVKQGEQVNGVLVATVTADRVKFTQGDDSEELILKAAPGPKTTTQPVPPGAATAAATPQGGMASLPGAAPAAAAPAAPAVIPDGQLTPARRAAGAATSAMPSPVLVPATTPTPALPAAAAAGQSPASPDPAWNETFERMRNRNAPTAK
jgi:hypothetical protein